MDFTFHRRLQRSSRVTDSGVPGGRNWPIHTLPDVNVEGMSRPVRHSINISCIMNINRVVY